MELPGGLLLRRSFQPDERGEFGWQGTAWALELFLESSIRFMSW